MTEVIIHTDGASRGNPGKAAIAYRIQLPEGEITHGEFIGQTTNNQAEYRAFVAALQRLVSEDVKEKSLSFFADSELMVKQIKGEYRVKDAQIKPVYQKAMELISELKLMGNTFEITAVRRELNKEADALANAALDKAG